MNLSLLRIAEIILILIITLFAIISIATSVQHYKMGNYSSVSTISELYYYQDGQKKTITLPASVQTKPGENLTLFCDSLTAQNANMTLTTRAAHYNLRIAYGDDVLYQYSETGFTRNDQMRQKLDCSAHLPEQIDHRILTFEYSGAPDGSYRIPRIYIGNDDTILNRYFLSVLPTLIIALAMILIGILSLLIFLVLKKDLVADLRFIDIAVFLFLCGIWIVTDSTITQQNATLSAVSSLISFYAFMLLSVPMLHFLKDTGDMKKYRGIDICIFCFYLNVILQSVLVAARIATFTQLLLLTHVILAGSVIYYILLLIHEYWINQTLELKITLLAFTTMAVFGLLALLLYWLLRIHNYEILFGAGILIFITLIISGVLRTAEEGYHTRTEMLAYQRMASEDELTGIGNRRAFEHYIANILEHPEHYQNAALIFLDVNNLKQVNDTYGHEAGDNIIISAAHCIEKAFRELGVFYRIGGDEFCVIIPNPKTQPAYWFDNLDHQLELFNKTNPFPISIARGFSYLKNSDGSFKTVSEWKSEADQNMYQNKLSQKKSRA